MNVSKEFLMEAVGLSLLVALILISMQMFERAMKMTALLEERQEQQMMTLINGLLVLLLIMSALCGSDLTHLHRCQRLV